MADYTNSVQSPDSTSVPTSGSEPSNSVSANMAQGDNLRARDGEISHPSRQDSLKNAKSAIHQAHHVLPANQPIPRRF